MKRKEEKKERGERRDKGRGIMEEKVTRRKKCVGEKYMKKRKKRRMKIKEYKEDIFKEMEEGE